MLRNKEPELAEKIDSSFGCFDLGFYRVNFVFGSRHLIIVHGFYRVNFVFGSRHLIIVQEVDRPNVRLRNMTCRWGSCTKAKNVFLNPLLIRTPKRCVRYVVAHELCHLISLRHDNKFFKLLNQVEPEWREIRKQLNETEL